MSHFLDRLTFFTRAKAEFADGHGVITNEDRPWEDGYRKRWQHDKIVRSTHGVNCTGLLLVEDLRQGRHRHLGDAADRLSAHPAGPAQPRAARLRSGRELQLVPLLGQPGEVSAGALAPAEAVARGARVDDAGRGLEVDRRGSGEARLLCRRSAVSAASSAPSWDEVNEIIAAANAYTAKTYGPDRVFGFSPIPAMSMVSYAAGSRYLSLLGGVCMSFYDWYCDLPPASPQTWGEQTDVPEIGRLVQFRLPDPVGLERPADPHARRPLLHRGPLQGRQERRDLPGLLRGLEIRRPLDLAEAGHRRRARRWPWATSS